MGMHCRAGNQVCVKSTQRLAHTALHDVTTNYCDAAATVGKKAGKEGKERGIALNSTP